jgi:hypothetical protein
VPRDGRRQVSVEEEGSGGVKNSRVEKTRFVMRRSYEERVVEKIRKCVEVNIIKDGNEKISTHILVGILNNTKRP